MLPEFTKGIIRENPLFVQLLGVCPALATTSSLTNALGMGAAFTAVLIGSNVKGLADFRTEKIYPRQHQDTSLYRRHRLSGYRDRNADECLCAGDL